MFQYVQKEGVVVVAEICGFVFFLCVMMKIIIVRPLKSTLAADPFFICFSVISRFHLHFAPSSSVCFLSGSPNNLCNLDNKENVHLKTKKKTSTYNLNASLHYNTGFKIIISSTKLS